MADRQRDEWLAAKLKAEADRYEPDLERIRERIREQRGDRPGRRGSSWLLPAAAATFVVLAAGTITALNQQPTGPPDVQVIGPAGSQTDLPSPAGPTSTAPPASTTTTDAPKPTVSPTRSATGSATTGPSRPTDLPTTTQKTAPPEVQIQVVTARPGQAVTLPDGAEDWIAAGSGSGGQTVRRANGEQTISGPHETGSAVSITDDGPFSLSWTGGMAEANRSGSRIWRTVTGPKGGPDTGLIFRVPAEKQTGTFVLYIGADDADAQLRTRLGQQLKVTRLKAAAGKGYVVTLRFHSPRPNEELTMELISGSGGSISFAAAALR
jgi:hypothetical protein